MNKYSDKSDLEINKAVAVALGAYDVMDGIYIDENRRYDFSNPRSKFFFDPCNNPADAMSIVIENGISLIFQDGIFHFATYDGNFEFHGDNPYRAAMEVFLMMKDAQ